MREIEFTIGHMVYNPAYTLNLTDDSHLYDHTPQEDRFQSTLMAKKDVPNSCRYIRCGEKYLHLKLFRKYLAELFLRLIVNS